MTYRLQQHSTKNIPESEVKEEDIDEDLDHNSSRMYLRLETGTSALLKSKEFQKFTEGKSLEEIKNIPEIEWEKMLWKVHLKHRISVDKELLLNYWLEQNPVADLDTEHPARGYQDISYMKNVRDLIMENEAQFENEQTIDTMSEGARYAFLTSYRFNNELGEEKNEKLQSIIDFIVYAYAIRSNAPQDKKAA